jgi:hypothetical protein
MNKLFAKIITFFVMICVVLSITACSNNKKCDLCGATENVISGGDGRNVCARGCGLDVIE